MVWNAYIVNHIWSFSLPHDIWPWVALKGQIKVIVCSFNFIGLYHRPCIIRQRFLRPIGLLLIMVMMIVLVNSVVLMVWLTSLIVIYDFIQSDIYILCLLFRTWFYASQLWHLNSHRWYKGWQHFSNLIMHHFNETETQWTYQGPWVFIPKLMILFIYIIVTKCCSNLLHHVAFYCETNTVVKYERCGITLKVIFKVRKVQNRRINVCVKHIYSKSYMAYQFTLYHSFDLGWLWKVKSRSLSFQLAVFHKRSMLWLIKFIRNT